MDGFSTHIYFYVSTDVRLVDNIKAGFSHFAAVLGCNNFNTLEKEQKSAALTSLFEELSSELKIQQESDCRC